MQNETNLHVVLRYDSQKVDVVVRVEASHVLAADGFRPKHLHLPVQAVVHNQVVGHANPVRFHGVPLTVVIVPDLGCKRKNTGGLCQKAKYCRAPLLHCSTANATKYSVLRIIGPKSIIGPNLLCSRRTDGADSVLS